MLVVVGPVFPHRSCWVQPAATSTSSRQFGAEILNLFHWLGALITNPMINWREIHARADVVNRAAALIPNQKRAFCLNVVNKEVPRDLLGSPRSLGRYAADAAAARNHIV